ncbi:MAG: zinc-binding dehydrogenase [Bacteroidetes bacterium]|nr:zinc-binding dehydrogenase [Bacteroidota bacterium]
MLAPQGALSTLSRNNITLYGISLTRKRKRLEEMKAVFKLGRTKPLIGETLPFGLEGIGRGNEKLESGHLRGKIVLSFK